MSRFNVVKASKFEKLSMAEMQSVKGGMICIACMKRERTWKIGLGTPSYERVDYTDSVGGGHTIGGRP